MPNSRECLQPQQLLSWPEEMETMARHIKQRAARSGALNILEAGCGTMWALDLQGLDYTLTGVDIDEVALDIRKNQRRDLDICILVTSAPLASGTASTM